MKQRILTALILAFVMIFPVMTTAKEIGGKNMPETLSAGTNTLALNGAGLRKKMWFKVYAGALYLSQKSGDAQKIIAADEPMAIRMHFIYDGVAAKKMIKGWNEGFDAGTEGNTAPIKEQIARFNGFFTEEAKEDDIYEVVYLPGEGVSVFMKGKKKGTIPGLEFKKAVFSIWLGKKAANKKLKKGMLGK